MGFVYQKPEISTATAGGLPLWTATVPVAAAALAVFTAQSPLQAIAILMAAGLAAVALRWPDVATLLVVFLIYTNAPVVAVRFHGLPRIVGAAVPLLLLLPLAYHLFVRREQLIVTPVVALIVLYGLVHVAGIFVARYPEIAVRKTVEFLVEGAALYFLMVNLVRTQQMLRSVVWTLLWAGIFMGGVPLLQFVTHTYETNYGGFAQYSERGYEFRPGALQPHMVGDDNKRDQGSGTRDRRPRVAGPVGEKNYYAQVMLVLAPLGLCCVWSEPSRWLRGVALIAICLCFAGVVLSYSRGAAVGLALATMVLLFLGYLSLRQFLAIALGCSILVFTIPQYRARMASLAGVASVGEHRGGRADTATKGRATEMLAAALVFRDHPIVGVGPGMFLYHVQKYDERIGIRMLTERRQSHTLFLGVAAEHGVLGLSCLLAILFLVLRELARTRNRHSGKDPVRVRTATAFLGAILLYLTSGLFLHFAYIRYFWLMLALASAAGSRGDSESEPSGSTASDV